MFLRALSEGLLVSVKHVLFRLRVENRHGLYHHAAQKTTINASFRSSRVLDFCCSLRYIICPVSLTFIARQIRYFGLPVCLSVRLTVQCRYCAIYILQQRIAR